jgi:heptosyltransferase-2
VKLLIRTTNWVGDAIMAIPALQTVRAKFPDAHIGVLGLPYVLDIYRGQGLADELIDFERSGGHGGLRGRERLASELRERRFDTAVLFQNAFDAAWIAWRAGISERIGYNRDGRGLLLTKPVAVPRAGEVPPHERYYYLELLRRVRWIDALPEISNISLKVEPALARDAEALLQSAGAPAGGKRIAVGPGASYGSAKCWPPERFAAALNQTAGQAGADIILFGTAGDAAVSAEIEKGLQHKAINLVGKTKISDLPALLSRCTIFLGNDSGAMHVAAAVGLPVVAIFGPTDPFGTAPVTPKCTIVQEKSYCSPCFLRRCPTDHRCMNLIAPGQVSDKVTKVLAEVAAA